MGEGVPHSFFHQEIRFLTYFIFIFYFLLDSTQV